MGVHVFYSPPGTTVTVRLVVFPIPAPKNRTADRHTDRQTSKIFKTCSVVDGGGGGGFCCLLVVGVFLAYLFGFLLLLVVVWLA